MNALKLLVLTALVSCGIGGPKGKLIFDAERDNAIRAENVNFTVLQKQILPKCISCHGDWTSERSIADLIQPGNPDGSDFFDSVKTGWMPKNAAPLTSAELEIVRNYIINLRVLAPAPIPLPTPAPTPTPTPEPIPAPRVTYQELRSKVFEVSCLPCHAEILNDEAVLNSTWVNQESPEFSDLLLETESGRMPKRRAPLTAEHLQLVRDYVNQFRK